MKVFSKIKNYFIQSFTELKKVTWPTRNEVISLTAIVIVSVAITMAFISLIDFGLFQIVNYVINSKS